MAKAIHRAVAAWLALFVLWLATGVLAATPVPPLKARVTDLTGTLSAAERDALEGELQAVEARNGSQIAVLLVPGTRPEAIEQFSMRVAEAWKLGRKGKDDGILLLVAKDERKLRIEVGYGLEGVIPDAIARRVIDETIAPRFKQSDYAGGISAGVHRLAALIDGHAAPKTEESPAPQAPAATGAETRVPSSSWPVTDMTGSLGEDQIHALGKRLLDFYDSGRTKPAYVVVVATTRPDSIAQYAARMLAGWGEKENLDVDRSLLLLLAKADGAAFIEAGAGLRERMPPGAAERAVAEVIEPQLRKGDLGATVEAGVREIEKLIDDAVNNKTFEERLIENVSGRPLWLLVLLAVVAGVLHWGFGPLFGGLAMAGTVGAGTWFVADSLELAIFGGLAGFVFAFVGPVNWISVTVGIGSSGGGGGGFSGGGGGFGGGGASGGW